MADTPVQTHPSEAETDPLLSGRYRLLEELGEGGMGLVYKGEHVLMKKAVAIKVLHKELTKNAEIVARFQREAQAAAALESPYVCQATDFGQTDDGAFFLVMEYLDGKTLQELIHDEGALEVSRALRLAKQVASALSAAHAQGIVHRDLKPENIMVVRREEGERVKIMDFGIARMLDPDDGDPEDPATRLTRAGMVYGTPHYMSPEQVAGEDVDERTDLYALGVVLFEMLTGDLPFDGETIARVMGQHVTQAPPTLAEIHPDGVYSSALEELIAHLLKKAPEARPQTADAVVRSIEEFLRPPEPEPLAAPLPASTAPSAPSVPNVATRSMEAISRGAISTGEVAVGSVELVVDQSLSLMERTYSWWSSLRSNQRKAFLIGVGLTSFLLVLVVALATVALFSTVNYEENLATDRQNRLDDALVTAALADAADGDRTSLEELLSEHPEDAHLRFLALQNALETNHDVDTLEEIQTILDLDDRYAYEPTLVSLLVEALYRSSTEEQAGEILGAHLTATSRAALSEIARTGTPRARRDKAYGFLDDHGQLRHFQRWEKLCLELRQSSGCNNLKEKIAEIEALGDARSLSTLEALNATPRRGCGALRARDCIGCIRGDLDRAISALQAD